MSRFDLSLVAILAVALSACGGGNNDGPTSQGASTMLVAQAAKVPASKPVVITLPETTAAVVGTPVQLVASVTDKSGKPVNGVALSWTSADTRIVSVSSAGLVTPLAEGSAAVTARASGASDSTIVTVRAASSTLVRSKYVGTNLAGLGYWSTQFPFANLMKGGTEWASRDDNGVWGAPFPSMTADGYPASLDDHQHALSTIASENSHYPAGRYVVLWDGVGTVSFPFSTVSVVDSSANRIAIEIPATTNSLWVSIDKTDPANPVHNLRFLLPGTESTYGTQPFNSAFLKKIDPFSVLRFMDWGGTNGSSLVNWADRPLVSDATYATSKGVPIELMIDLANKQRVDPWFCIPHRATDDYVRQFAEMLHARLDASLKPHIEYSNEVWNTGFQQTSWAVGESQRLGLPTPFGMPSAFYAQRSVEVFNIFQQVFGPTDSGRLVRVLAGQAVWTQFLENALAWNGAAAHTDVIAIAPYFNASSAADPANVRTTLRLSSDDVVDQMFASVRGPVKSAIISNAALATQYKLKMKAYESGPGDSTAGFPADKVDAVTALFAAANRNSRMRDLYVEYYGLWIGNGGETMNQYNDIGPWMKWGMWGALEYVEQDRAASPKYMGLLDVIATHPLLP